MTTITSETATAAAISGRSPTVDLRQTRDVLEQIALIHQAIGELVPSSPGRSQLVSTRDQLASLLPAQQGAGPPMPSPMPSVREPSGPVWVSRFPGSASPADCIDPFRSNEGVPGRPGRRGGTSQHRRHLRPPERAYLMHWS